MSQEHDAPFVAPPPPSPVEGSSLYPPHVLESKAKEARSDAKNALIMSIVGLFCFGITMGWLARHLGRLGAGSTAHCINNTLSVLIAAGRR